MVVCVATDGILGSKDSTKFLGGRVPNLELASDRNLWLDTSG
jgi:hypothetical protein